MKVTKALRVTLDKVLLGSATRKKACLMRNATPCIFQNKNNRFFKEGFLIVVACATKHLVFHPQSAFWQAVMASNRSFRRRRKPAWILGFCLRQ